MDVDGRVCLKCIRDDELRRLVSDEASRGVCGSCRQRRQAVPCEASLSTWTRCTGSIIFPEGNIAHFDAESDNPRYEQEGEEPQWIIQEIVGVEPDIADGIVDLLSDEEAHDITRWCRRIL